MSDCCGFCNGNGKRKDTLPILVSYRRAIGKLKNIQTLNISFKTPYLTHPERDKHIVLVLKRILEVFSEVYFLVDFLIFFIDFLNGITGGK